ncbi:MAG: XdhC family protein [Alphaproteobacteria bacterium]|nr:XdhC family protein [Alphaproteobacteria bacterium]
MKRELLAKVLEARVSRKAVALVTDLATGDQRLVTRAGAKDDPLAASLDEAFRFDQSGSHDGQFINIHNPALRLVIIGAVHIAQSVIPIAQQLGYDVVVIDPRGAFATGARFPGISLHAEWPDEVIPQIGLDARTAMIALTHDPKIDDPALHAALASEAFYIGALGSKKTQTSRVARLKDAGFTDQQIGRIHGPIGLSIGAKGAPEIAVSIVAEMTQALRLGA